MSTRSGPEKILHAAQTYAANDTWYACDATIRPARNGNAIILKVASTVGSLGTVDFYITTSADGATGVFYDHCVGNDNPELYGPLTFTAADENKQLIIPGVAPAEVVQVYFRCSAGAASSKIAIEGVAFEDTSGMVSNELTLSDIEVSVAAPTGTQDVNIAEVLGTAVNTNGGNRDAQTITVTLADDDPAVAALEILDNIVSGSEAQVDIVTIPETNVNLQDGAGTDLTSTLVGADQSLDVNLTQSVTLTETNSAAILADTAAMDTNLATVAGTVAGSEVQVDVVTAPETNVNLQDGAGTDLTSTLVASDQALDVNVVQSVAPGAGGSVYTDDDDWTDSVSEHTLVGGLYQSVQQTITDGDVGPIQLDANGNVIESNSAAILSDTTAILADTANMDTNLGTVAGAVSGTEMQVDVLTVPETNVNLQDGAGTDLTSTLVGADQSLDVNLTQSVTLTETNSAAILADTAAMDTNLATIAGDTTSLDGKVTACNTGAVTISAALPAGANTIGNVNANLQDGAGTDLTSTLVASDQALDVNVVQTVGGSTRTKKTPTLFTQAVAVPGTAEAFAGSVECTYFAIQAKRVDGANTSPVYIGTSAVDKTSQQTIKLAIDEKYEFSAPDGVKIDLSEWYVDSETATDGITGIYLPV